MRWWWVAVAAAGAAVGWGVISALRQPIVRPGPVQPGPGLGDWRDTGERLEVGRIYRVRREVALPHPVDGQLTGDVVLAPPGWYVAVQRGPWDPWGWAAVGTGELGVSGLPPWWTTRALVYGRGAPSNRVQSTLIRDGVLQLG